jgi:hypothetical protein
MSPCLALSIELMELQSAHLLELRPTTGRKHQLRVLLSALRAPILFDARYGGTKAAALGAQQPGGNGICLHATSLSFYVRVSCILLALTMRADLDQRRQASTRYRRGARAIPANVGRAVVRLIDAYMRQLALNRARMHMSLEYGQVHFRMKR